jgi:hypothetical protein
MHPEFINYGVKRVHGNGESERNDSADVEWTETWFDPRLLFYDKRNRVVVECSDGAFQSR